MSNSPSSTLPNTTCAYDTSQDATQKNYQPASCSDPTRAGGCQLLDPTPTTNYPNGFGYPCAGGFTNDSDAWDNADQTFIGTILPRYLNALSNSQKMQQCADVCSDSAGNNLLSNPKTWISNNYTRTTCLPTLSDACLQCIDPGATDENPFNQSDDPGTIAGFRRVYSCARCRQLQWAQKTPDQTSGDVYQAQAQNCCCNNLNGSGNPAVSGGSQTILGMPVWGFSLFIAGLVLLLIIVIAYASSGRKPAAGGVMSNEWPDTSGK